MTDRLHDLLSHDLPLFAQEAGEAAKPGVSGIEMFAPFVVLFVLFYFLVLGPGRREQKRRKEMLAALKKNDRVLTQGGIIGTIANISPDGQKVTVKVDDNIRLPVHRGYIVTVLTEESSGEGEGKAG
ncbi:MAG: preprotein translocase subunit YajC [Planctomycetaceae bacterium]